MFRVLICLLLLSLSVDCFALEFPPAPTQRVNDFAGVLTQQEKEELEAMLRLDEQQTSNQIVVAIFPSLEQESLEDFVNRLFEKWAIGQRANNNGVLLAIFLKERQIRIEVGYGLEGRLTDALASRIIRNELAPEFRTGRYGPGIRKGVLAIEKAIAGEYKPVAQPEQPPEQYPPGAIFIGFLILMYLLYRIRNRGTYIDRRGRRYRNDDWFIYPGGRGPGGWGSGGGWSGGGGGGFSGGGGSSGGGGASGSW